MALETKDSERRRVRWALICLSLGAALVLAAAGMGMCRGSPAPTRQSNLTMASGSMPVEGTQRQKSVARLATLVLLTSSTLLLVLLCSYLLIRGSGRRRVELFRKPPPPSDSTDVWGMHKLTPDALEAWQDDKE